MPKRKPGELESQVLSCLWDRPDGLSSQQILALLGDDELAPTTVLTVLTRLTGKGLVEKGPGSGRTLMFRATTTREKHSAAQMMAALEGANQELVFSHFASGLTKDQLSKLNKALNQ